MATGAHYIFITSQTISLILHLEKAILNEERFLDKRDDPNYFRVVKDCFMTPRRRARVSLQPAPTLSSRRTSPPNKPQVDGASRASAAKSCPGTPVLTPVNVMSASSCGENVYLGGHSGSYRIATDVCAKRQITRLLSTLCT